MQLSFPGTFSCVSIVARPPIVQTFYMSPQCIQERSTCRHVVSIREFTRSRIVMRVAFYMSPSTPSICYETLVPESESAWERKFRLPVAWLLCTSLRVMCSGFREYAVAEIEYVKIGAPAHDTLIIL